MNTTLFSGPSNPLSFQDVLFKFEAPLAIPEAHIQEPQFRIALFIDHDPEFIQPEIYQVQPEIELKKRTNPFREKLVRFSEGIKKTGLFFQSVKNNIAQTHQWLTHKLLDRPYSAIFNIRTTRQISKGHQDGTPIPEEDLFFMELMRVIFIRTAKQIPWIVIKAAAIGGIAVGLGFAIAATAGAAGITLPLNPVAWGSGLAFFILIRNIINIAADTIGSLAGDRKKHIKYGSCEIKLWPELTYFERFRRILWKAVNGVEIAADYIVDKPFSWLFRIRTLRQMREDYNQKLDNKDYDRLESKLAVMEIFRGAVLQQIKYTTLSCALPFISAGYIMDAFGLPIMTTATTIGVIVAPFIYGLVVDCGYALRLRRKARKRVGAAEAIEQLQLIEDKKSLLRGRIAHNEVVGQLPDDNDLTKDVTSTKIEIIEILE